MVMQSAQGNYIAQAGSNSTASVNVYQNVYPASVDEAMVEAAQKQLAELPLDAIPEVTTLPKGSRMPFNRNPFFVGRENDLLTLASALKGGETVAIGQVAAATGLGGIGKTQLASEFVHRYGQYFAGGVFWLSFASETGIRSEVVLCGRRGTLELRFDFSTLPFDQQVELVLSAWQSELPRLLVFDNCENEALLEKWRPKTGGSRILLTSRRAVWNTLGVQNLTLGVLNRDESVALLLQFRPDLSPDDPNLHAIAEELGDLPLALHLAGSYLRTYRHSAKLGKPAAYLEQLRRSTLLSHVSMKHEATPSPTGHEQHVTRTFELSYQRLDESDEIDLLALKLLQRAACMAGSTPIPRKLLLATLELSDETEEDDEEEAWLLSENALNRLINLGLLQQESDGTLLLHRLLTLFVRERTTDSTPQTAVEHVLLAEARRLNEAGYPKRLQAWQEHLRTVTDAARQREDEIAAKLCNVMGINLYTVPAYKNASPYFKRALVICQKVLGEGHPLTAASLYNLGSLFYAQRQYESARPYYERALAIHEKVLGEEHPDTATNLNSLGLLFHIQGQYESARPYYERALAIRKKVLGEEHVLTVISLNNFAQLLSAQGEDESACLYFERVLAITRRC